jgi:hypothetical protein
MNSESWNSTACFIGLGLVVIVAIVWAMRHWDRMESELRELDSRGRIESTER